MDAEDVFTSLLTPGGRDDPYPLYAALHELGAAVAVPAAGLVIVHGYDAVDAVLRDPDFAVADAAFHDEMVPGWREHPSAGMHSLLNLNPPDHARIRAPVARTFTARRVAGLQAAIIAMTDRLLDVLADAGSDGSAVEFMNEFAFRLPVSVICELLGVPEPDRAEFRPLARDLAAVLELRVDAATVAAADDAARRLQDYFACLAAQRREHPREDLVSALVAISGEHGALTAAELLENLMLLLVAGFETTANLLGNGLQVLLHSPGLAAALRDGSLSAGAFVAEVLRYDSPVQLTERRPARPAVAGGVPVDAGTEVITLLGAGNRDPRRFAGPDVFDPSRPGPAPLSFGAGAHFCLGSGLARLEGALALHRIVTRLPRLAAAGQPQRRPGLVLRGFAALPVTVA